ncbi:MAG: GNAT family N-acetyltransferase [Polyangiaceae bacterium]
MTDGTATDAVTVVPMTVAHVDEVAALTARRFAPAEAERVASRVARAYRECPFLRVEDGLVAIRAGRVVGKVQLLDFALRVGSTSLRAAGVHTLAVEEAVDGERLPWSSVATAFGRWEARGHDVLFGVARKGAAYEAHGARALSPEYAWSVDAWRLPNRGSTEFRAVTDDDGAAIVAITNAAQASRPLSLVRTPEGWPWIERRAPVELVGHGGYLALRDDDDSVEVREAAGPTREFHLAALRHVRLRAEARRVSRVHGHLPVDHPLVLASRDHGARVVVDHARRSGTMGLVLRADRVVDALAGEFAGRLAASAFRDQRVDLEVRLLHDMDRPGRVTFGSGSGGERVAMTLGGGAFAQAIFGHRTAEEASETIEGSAHAREIAGVLFPAGVPFLQHTDRF